MPRKVVLAVLLSTMVIMALPSRALADPPYIYAMHDPGGESHMGASKGWIVFTEAIGSNPANFSGVNYASYTNAGYGVVVRLNNGYGSDGTIPHDSQYDNFAQRCANFVNASSDIDYWIIGNETNLPREWPGNVDGNPTTGQPITVARYVSCYNKCYAAVKAVKPGARLVPTPSGTWSPPWPGQGIEGFVDYWVNILNGIGSSKIDGLALHAYTHGCDPALVTNTQKMGPPYTNIYYHFFVYKNYMSAIPAALNTRPVLITECDQNIECADNASPRHTWSNANSGWVRNIYSEINAWNSANSQKIRCVAMFRWPNAVEGEYTFGIQSLSGVIQDFQQACALGYKWSDGFPIAIQRGNGLANVFAKLNAGQPATIAYIGGSVTQNPGWRDNVTAWFNSRYPGKITERNAGWSGTGSLIGAMRLTRDVLAYNPDLIFVEFAINDLPEDPLLFVERNAEGIVRQTWTQNPNIDVCFIETIASYTVPAYQSGQYPTPVQAHYAVADRYGNPSINVGWQLYTHVLAGSPLTNYLPDGAHPNSAGSAIYSNEAVIPYLESERTRGGASSLHTIPSALTDFPVMNSTIQDMASLTALSSAWVKHFNEYGVSSFIQSSTAGSTVALNFTGPAAAANIVVAPDGGNISYSLDGGAFVSGNIPTTPGAYVWAFPVSKTASTTAAHTLTLRVDSGIARIINLESANSASAPGPSGTNLALTAAAAQADTTFGSGFDANKARDGLTSTKWTSTSATQNHWLAYDLGATADVSSFIVQHASNGGEEAYYNTQDFTLESAPSLSGPWLTEFTGSNAVQAGSSRFDYTTPKALRYVRLNISDPGIDNYARIPEFEVWGTLPTSPPPTPTGLNATAGDAQVSLTWNPSSGATSYNVKRSTTSGGPYSTIANPATPNHTNTGLTNGTTYYYVVSAVNGAGQSENSTQVSATPAPGGPPLLAEDFTALPGWASSFDAAWGNVANWSIVAGGQSGNCLQASRTGSGSSAKTLLYNLSSNTDYTLSIYIRCPSGGATYWAETAFKLGGFGAQHFDENPGAWTMVQKFASDGVNGNGDAWTQYSAAFNSGVATQISVGFKLGSSGTNGPIVRWDTLRIEAAATHPTISLAPASLSPSTSAGTSPASQSFTVQNTGAGTLNYTVAVNQSWLAVTPISGASTTVANTHTVNYSTAGLAAGTHNAAITVSDPNASNTPQTIPITLTVNTGTIPPDFDSDLDVDQGDLNHLLTCMTGAGQGPPAPGCQDADLDYDNDVDQSDFSILQRCLSGPGAPAHPACAN